MSGKKKQSPWSNVPTSAPPLTREQFMKNARAMLRRYKRRHFTGRLIGPPVSIKVKEWIENSPKLMEMYERFCVPEECNCTHPERHE